MITILATEDTEDTEKNSSVFGSGLETSALCSLCPLWPIKRSILA